MAENRICRNCNAPLMADAPRGLCPACLIRLVATSLEPQAKAAAVNERARKEIDAFSAALEPLTEGPGTIIGRYKLLQLLGKGGFGAVYLAEQKEPVKRRVALKIIKLGLDTKQVVARFEAERQALALMDHPNIAKVLDAGATETGRPYFVMELVHGVSITQYCDENNLPPLERVKLFTQVCHAIQHAHQKGIIHRDIKPSNILITLHDGVPVPKVIDFGIAKATQQALTEKTVFTQFQQFIGTPAYMSPEQAELSGSDIDTRSDIYALGVLLYELLTGKTPFDPKTLLAAGLDEMRRIIREQEPPKPSTRLTQELVAADVRRLKSPGSETPASEEEARATSRRLLRMKELIRLVRGDLDWIVMKCLEKDRRRRYETANGLVQDLERHLTHQPVVARPASTAYRVQKFARRNKVMVTAAGLVAAALVLGLVVSIWQAVLAGHQRVRAEANEQKALRAQASEAEQRRVAVQAREVAQRSLYVANMNMAQLAWEQNNIGRLRQALEDTRNSPHRGFEWNYWQPKTRLGLMTLRGHLDDVSSVAFSPDGQRIATASWDMTARVWDTASGRELLELKGHAGPIDGVAFSRDGRRIVTGSQDHTAIVWEAAAGQALLTLRGHTHWIWSVAFSPDGERIVTGSEDDTAKIWNATTGRELRTLAGHGDKVFSVAFSADGQRIVTGSMDSIARVWEAASGRCLFPLSGHTAGIASVAYSADGQRIVTGSLDKTARVWDAASGRELLKLKKDSGLINAVAFDPDGQRIVTGNDDNTVTVWDAASASELFTLKGHSGPVMAVAVSRDGQRIVTGSGDRTAKVWKATHSGSADITDGNLTALAGHSSAVHCVAFSSDGRRVVTGSEDRTAKLWDAASGQHLRTLEGHSNGVYSAVFSPDGQRVVTGSWDNTAKVWEASTGKELLTLHGHSDGIRSVALSPDGQRIVTGGGDQIAKVWEAASGRELLTLEGHRKLGFQDFWVAFSADGRRILTGSFDQTAAVWEAASGRRLFTFTGHTKGITSVAFSPDGQRIVTGSWDKTARVWDSASGKELLKLTGHTDWIWSVGFSPDGQRIVTGSADRTARLWETAGGRELLALKLHGNAVKSVAFSSDGQRIATGSWDNTAVIWEGARPEQVAAWQREDEAFAARQRERAAQEERERIVRARDSIKRWLILAPIALAKGQDGSDGLDFEQIQSEGRLRPREGEMTWIGGVELKWRQVTLTNEVLDLRTALGRETTQSVAYAVSYLRADAAQRGLRMLVGSDDDAKVYLNGKQVYQSRVARVLSPDQDQVPGIALNPGLNVLVFKVVNETGPWMGSIRFTDAEGNPVKGIEATLSP